MEILSLLILLASHKFDKHVWKIELVKKLKKSKIRKSHFLLQIQKFEILLLMINVIVLCSDRLYLSFLMSLDDNESKNQTFLQDNHSFQT